MDNNEEENVILTKVPPKICFGHLIRGPVYENIHEILFKSIMDYAPVIRQFANDLGLVLRVNQDAGVCALTQMGESELEALSHELCEEADTKFHMMPNVFHATSLDGTAAKIVFICLKTFINNDLISEATIIPEESLLDDMVSLFTERQMRDQVASKKLVSEKINILIKKKFLEEEYRSDKRYLKVLPLMNLIYTNKDMEAYESKLFGYINDKEEMYTEGLINIDDDLSVGTYNA